MLVLITVGVYVVVGTAGALLFGREWLRTADPVQVASTAVGAIAPIGRSRSGVRLRSPRRGVGAALAPPGLGVFLGVLIGINLFDALPAFFSVLASDPLRRGWNLLGLTGQEIVAEPIPPTLGLALQALLLVAGHALAMVVASDLAARHLRPRAASASLFPVRAAIVASLVLGVFLRFGLTG